VSDEPLYPISDAMRSAMWRVDHYAVAIMRQDDRKKVARLIREYRKSADRLLLVATDERLKREAGR
jgi:hypothetical protein